MTDHWTPVDREEAASLVGEGVHAGLRKGSDAPTSAALWRAIFDGQDGAWEDAVAFFVDGLEYSGLAICKKAHGPTSSSLHPHRGWLGREERTNEPR